MKDLSGDGKVTQKDVLMGRGVIKKKAGGMTKKYAGGGSICADCPSPAKCKAAGKCMKAAAGGMAPKAYKKGGKVRGCGMAKKGVRKAKMVGAKKSK